MADIAAVLSVAISQGKGHYFNYPHFLLEVLTDVSKKQPRKTLHYTIPPQSLSLQSSSMQAVSMPCQLVSPLFP